MAIGFRTPEIVTLVTATLVTGGVVEAGVVEAGVGTVELQRAATHARATTASRIDVRVARCRVGAGSMFQREYAAPPPPSTDVLA
jgi:hypothetical protein